MNGTRLVAAATVVAGLAGGLGIAAEPTAPPALNVTELGNGPTVVLVHGLGSGRMQWMPVARKLIATHRVVLVDLPGHGSSPMPEPFTLEAAAEALDRVVAKHRAESTVVVGHRVGGLLALLAASAHPEHQRGLILIETGLKTETPIPDQQQKYFLRYLDEHYDEFLRAAYSRGARDSAQGVALHAQAAQVPPAHMKAYFRTLLNVDATRAFKAHTSSLLFVGTDAVWKAEKDWPTLAKQLGYEAPEAIPTRRMSQGGALVMTEQPDSLAAIIADFTARSLAKP
jgi:pimeloyl-ACP methyl ester carboxylesterase